MELEMICRQKKIKKQQTIICTIYFETTFAINTPEHISLFPSSLFILPSPFLFSSPANRNAKTPIYVNTGFPLLCSRLF